MQIAIPHPYSDHIGEELSNGGRNQVHGVERKVVTLLTNHISVWLNLTKTGDDVVPEQFVRGFVLNG